MLQVPRQDERYAPLGREEALRDQLSRQWSLMEMPEALRRPGQVLIDWMDDDGYLRSEAEHHSKGGNGDEQMEATPLIIQRTPDEARRLLEEIGASAHPPLDVAVLEQALSLVQTLEPTGVGARDLTECLLIQLAGQENVDPLCEEIVRKYLVELAKNNFPAVAKATGRDIEEIKDALRVIGRLNHHPGHLVRQGDVQGITPDIIVDNVEEGDEYDVRLARGNTPRLRINAQYREMLQDRDADKEAREFIRVDERTVTVEKWSPPGLHGGQDPGGRMAWSFQRAWTRVELQAGSPAHWPTRLVVRSSGQRVEVGAFLTDGERQGLWSRLAGLLNETGTAAGAGTARRAGLDSL